MQEERDIAALVRSARGGDQNAIAGLYEACYRNVYLTLKAKIKDEDTVLDLTQDSFLKAFASLDQLEEPEKFNAWVKTIANHKALDHLKAKRPTLFSDIMPAGWDGEEDYELPFVDEREASNPEARIDREETARLIGEILDGLSEVQRAAAGYFYYDGLSIREIAQQLGKSEDSVKQYLFKARKQIEKKVEELEKKGTKLYGFAPLPFLFWLFRNLSETLELPAGGLAEISAATAGEAAAAAVSGASAVGATSAASGSAVAGAAAGLGGKAAAIAIAAVLAVSGTAAVVLTRNAGSFAEAIEAEATVSYETGSAEVDGVRFSWSLPLIDVVIPDYPEAEARIDAQMEQRNNSVVRDMLAFLQECAVSGEAGSNFDNRFSWFQSGRLLSLHNVYYGASGMLPGLGNYDVKTGEPLEISQIVTDAAAQSKLTELVRANGKAAGRSADEIELAVLYAGETENSYWDYYIDEAGLSFILDLQGLRVITVGFDQLEGLIMPEYLPGGSGLGD